MSKIYQLHWQFDDRTEMKAQSDPANQEQMRAWIQEVQEESPLPDGAKWLMCNENSKYFVWAVEPVNVLQP